MRSILIILFIMLVGISAKSQKWQPGYYYDVQGNKETGLIRTKTTGRSPVKDEAFIEFKAGDKAKTIKLSASDLRAFIVGRDSFVVAAAPRTGAWSDNELDFVKVVIDAPLRLYAFTGRTGGEDAHSAVGIGIGGGFGSYGGGFGTSIGGGVMFPLGGGGHIHTAYYFGANTAEMQELTNENFADIMSQIMGDEPDIVNKIKNGDYNLGNIQKLIDLYNKQEAADNGQPAGT